MIPNAAEWQIIVSYSGKTYKQRFRRSNINSPAIVKMIARAIGCGAPDVQLLDNGGFIIKQVHSGAWVVNISKTK